MEQVRSLTFGLWKDTAAAKARRHRGSDGRSPFKRFQIRRKGQLVLNRLREAFPDQYIALDEPVPEWAAMWFRLSESDHRFNWGYGATIYVRDDCPDIARILRSALVNNRPFPNCADLLAYAEDEDLDTNPRGNAGLEYLFRCQHVEDLIRILRADH